MSEIKSKIKKITNGLDSKNISNVTRYDFTEFCLELMAIQDRNKVTKKLENQLKVSDSKEAKKLIKSQVKEIMSQNIIDERLDVFEPNPRLKNLFKELDERFFDGFLKRNNVNAIWNKSLKTKAYFREKVINEKIISHEISLSRAIFKSIPRRELTEALLFMMIQTYVLVNNQDYPMNEIKYRNLMVSKINEIKERAKTDLDFSRIAEEISDKSKVSKRFQRQPTNISSDQLEIKEEPNSD